jgi:hypothetical protein
MKFLTGLIALTVAVPGLAHAANISGTYSIKLTTLCQSIENEVFNKTGGTTTTVINTINEGKIQQTVGVITFTPTKAGGLTGKVSATFTQTKGTLAILGLPGGTGQPATPHVPDMQIGTENQTGTSSLTLPKGSAPAVISIAFSGDTGDVFTAYLSKLNGTTYTHADFIDIDGDKGSKPSCSNSGSIEHN